MIAKGKTWPDSVPEMLNLHPGLAHVLAQDLEAGFEMLPVRWGDPKIQSPVYVLDNFSDARLFLLILCLREDLEEHGADEELVRGVLVPQRVEDVVDLVGARRHVDGFEDVSVECFGISGQASGDTHPSCGTRVGGAERGDVLYRGIAAYVVPCEVILEKAFLEITIEVVLHETVGMVEMGIQ